MPKDRTRAMSNRKEQRLWEFAGAVADAMHEEELAKVRRDYPQPPSYDELRVLLAQAEQQCAEGWKYVDALRAEVERLRVALRWIQEWDCLNPPDPKLCADHPWLRRLVDEALGET